MLDFLAHPFLEGFDVASKDTNRPWGGFYCINEQFTQRFINTYFTDLIHGTNIQYKNVSPKILVILPHQRLSWQYHSRREELWMVLQGPVSVVLSSTDQLTEPITYQTGEFVFVNVEQRHRLVGLDNVAIIAELWVHTDELNPSDESDIVRVQDDYTR
jgi:mannose-6-phosphate isomerase-like protein (cupin superfamily)